MIFIIMPSEWRLKNGCVEFIVVVALMQTSLKVYGY